MTNNADFESFLKDINPSRATIDEASRLQQNLRAHLSANDNYKNIYRNSYLSGSYAKKTFIRPRKDSDGCDIDIIVETNHSNNDSPYTVLCELRDAILERNCYNEVKVQSHSVGIEMASFHIDVVPLAEGDDGILYIGSKDDGSWKQTNPKGHISWSTEVNQNFSDKYKPLVKIMKWWRRENCPEWNKFPKGITLEKMIADNLRESELTIEESVMQTMANLAEAYTECTEACCVPFIADPVLPNNNLAAKYKVENFSGFISKLNEHLTLLANEGTSNSTWKKILGNNFPSENSKSNMTSLANSIAREAALSVKHRQRLNFPMQAPKPNATVTATVTLPSGESFELTNDGPSLPKGTKIVYRVNCGPLKNGVVKWQITNTGEEAMQVCRRGGFEPPNEGKTSRREETAYTGKHYVQCFIVRKGYCMRWTNPFFINVE